ncbi:PLP-dependent transferase [Thozetella sp. PMI_491]|nr:PLP-dependent transferase [Thozetella sp. PMI_491]
MSELSFLTKTAEVNHDYDTHIAGGFAPLPIAIATAQGSVAYDVDGKQYIDFLSMIAVNNMGHGHPRIVNAAVKALLSGATVNLAVQSPYYGQLARRMFNYDRFVALTSGGEAADAALKIARKWGHLVKKIPPGKCHVLSTSTCYHGVGLSTLSLFSYRSSLFQPFLPNTGHISPSGHVVRFGNLEDVKIAFEADGINIAAIIVEPIQGASGVIMPPDDYLPGLAELCKKHNVLLIADEIQTGLGRCGHPLFHMKYNIRPDLVILGKALSGGVYPMSGVLGDNCVMELLDPAEIGSTMAANPPGCAAALAALDVLVDENLCARANEMGELLESTIKSLNPPHIIEYTGAGMLRALVMAEKVPRVTARRLAALLAQRGLIANGIKGGRIRLCPPLNIDRDLLIKGAHMVAQALVDLEDVPDGLPGEVIPFQYGSYLKPV